MSLNKIKINNTTTVNTGVVYDITKATSQSYDSLSAALGTDGNNVPLEIREGGMSIRFVQTSDNKYVQYRLMSNSFNTIVGNWQGIDDEPTVGSYNLVKSGGIIKLFAITTNNLFNKETVTLNSYINGYNGSVVESQNWWCSDFVPVKSSTNYSHTRLLRDYAFYDIGKNYISGVINMAPAIITTPSNASYIRFSFYLRGEGIEENIYPKDVMFNQGDTLLPYEPFGAVKSINPDLIPPLKDKSIGLNNLDNSIITNSDNLFNKDTITPDAYVQYSTGNIITNQSGWWCSDFIPVEGNTMYNGSTIRDIAWYDVNKNYISGIVDLPTMPITSPQNAAYIRFSQYQYPTEGFMFNKGEEALPFVPYCVLINPHLLPSSDEQIGVTLPQRIYAVVGDTIQIFFRGIIKAVNPYNYDICVTASAGRMYPRYYELTASSAGTVSFNVKLKNSNGVIVGSASTVIDVKQAVAQPSSEKNILFIGDSLTAAGVYTQETYRRLTGTGGTPAGNEFGNIAFVGRKPYGNIHAEGNSGWSWTDYVTKADRTYAECYTLTVNSVTTIPSVESVYTDGINQFIMWWDYSSTKLKFKAEGVTSLPSSGTLTKVSGTGDDIITWTAAVKSSVNPFWNDDTEQLDFTAYVNKWCGGKIDVVYTLLTWNGLGEVIGSQDFSSLVGYAKTLYRHIHTNYPNVKIKMMGIQVPDCRQGMGVLGAPHENSYTDMYKLILTALNMNAAYEELCLDSEFSSYVEFIHISSQVDSEYNMPFIEKDVNIRNSNYKDKVGTNDVHPNTDGYLQIADAVYRNFICNFCQ